MLVTARQWRRWQHCALLALSLALCPPPSQATDDEALIKAGFISKFPSFVTWPGHGETPAHQAFRFCVLGDSPVTVHLKSLAALDKINGGQPVVNSVADSAQANTCQLLLIPSARASQLEDILREIGDRPVLLVADAPGLAERGAHIDLFRSGDRLRFAINRAAFRRSGLKVSFRLLEMARVVE